MKLLTHLVFAYTLLASFATAETATQSDQKVTIWIWPVDAKSPKELAQVSYNSDRGTGEVKKYSPPSLKFNHDHVRVGLYDSKSNDWRGVVTTASSFDPQYQLRLSLHISKDTGLPYHVGFAAYPPPEVHGRPKTPKNQIELEILKPTPGPTPVLNKPVVLSPEGKVQEKTDVMSFLQKYWWVIVLLLVVQVMVGGQAEK